MTFEAYLEGSGCSCAAANSVALRPRPIDEADLDEEVMQHEIRRRLPGLDGDAFPDVIVQDDPGGLSDGDAVLCPSRAGRGATPCGAR